MSDAVLVAIIAACVTIVGTLSPIITVWLTGRQRASERAEDYVRQDERAKRVEAVAGALVADNKVVAGRMADQSAAIEHVRQLVNSDMDRSLTEQRDARRAQVITLRELTALRERNGQPPSTETLETITALERRIAELSDELDNRARQVAVVDNSATA
jgi:alkylation response protein AidB-like acyl-CoA dehydrogenase